MPRFSVAALAVRQAGAPPAPLLALAGALLLAAALALGAGRAGIARNADSVGYAQRTLELRARRASELVSAAEAFSYQFIANPALNDALQDYGADEEPYDVSRWNGQFSGYLEGISAALPELDDALFIDADRPNRIPLTMTDSLTRARRVPIQEKMAAAAIRRDGKPVWDILVRDSSGETSRPTRRAELLCARLVKNLSSGAPIGIAVLVLDSQRLARTVTGSGDESDDPAKMPDLRSDFTVLVDGKGTILAGAGVSMAGKPFADLMPGTPMPRGLLDGQGAWTSTLARRGGGRSTLVRVRIEGHDWSLIGVIPGASGAAGSTGAWRASSVLSWLLGMLSVALFAGASALYARRRRQPAAADGTAQPTVSGEAPRPDDPHPPEEPPAWFENLTEREREILLLLASGHSNKEIAACLMLREQTVKNYLHGIYLGIGVQDRVSATLLVERAGLAPRAVLAPRAETPAETRPNTLDPSPNGFEMPNSTKVPVA